MNNNNLREYVVVTKNGERSWMAEDANHAREQHNDAFAGHDGENVIEVYRAIEDMGP